MADLGIVVERLKEAGNDAEGLTSIFSGLAQVGESTGTIPSDLLLDAAKRLIDFAGKHPESWTEEIAHLTNLHPDIGSMVPKKWYQEFGAWFDQHPEEETQTNKEFYIDMLFRYHLWKSAAALEENDLPGLVRHLNASPAIMNRTGAVIPKMIVHHFMKSKLIPSDPDSLQWLEKELGIGSLKLPVIDK